MRWPVGWARQRLECVGLQPRFAAGDTGHHPAGNRPGQSGDQSHALQTLARQPIRYSVPTTQDLCGILAETLLEVVNRLPI